MNISLFSFMMSVLFSTIFILAIHTLRNQPFFLKSFGAHTLLSVYGLCLFRMVFVIELPFTVPIGLKGAFSRIYALIRDPVSVGSFSASFVDILFSVWIIVAVSLFIRLMWQEYIARRSLVPFRKNKSYSAEKTLAKVQKVFSGKMSVNICVCPDIDTPMGLGVFRRWIYLPDEEYAPEELFYIITHEYTHFLNRDGLVKLLTLLFCCLFWWNPAVYLLKKDVEQILEIKCDVNVTQDFSKKERLEYLLTIVRTIKGKPQPISGSSSLLATGLVSRTEHDDIKERFELITKATKRVKLWHQAVFLGMAVLVTMLSYTFVLQSSFEPPIEDVYTDDSVVEWNSETIYLLQHRDGTYSLVLENGDTHPIGEQFLHFYLDSGTEIRKE